MNLPSRATPNRIFDMVYVKNVGNSMRRLLSVDKQLRDHNITYRVIQATTDTNTDVARIYNEYRKRPLGKLEAFPEYSEREQKLGRHFMESAATVGYIYTMLDVFADAKKHGYNKILILDDDIVLSNDFEDRLHALFSSIGLEWKIVHLGASQYDWSTVNETIALQNGHYKPRLLHTYGSFALAIDSSIFDQVSTMACTWESPFDMLPLGFVYEIAFGKCYVAYPNIVIADVRQSLIRGTRDQVSHSQLMRWRLQDFPFPPPRPIIGLVLKTTQLLGIAQGVLREHSLEGEGPFILNLYCSTGTGGIRPLHNQTKGCNDGLRSSLIQWTPIWTPDFLMTTHLGVGMEDIIYFLKTQLDSTLSRSTVLGSLKPRGPLQAVKEGLVTVIIPSRRVEHLIRAVNSVVRQNYPFIEIIVVMDRVISLEDEAVVNQLQVDAQIMKPGLSLHVISHDQPQGGAAARNSGIMRSHGEYVAFLDDDDIYLPGRLSKSVEVLRHAGPTVGAVFCGYIDGMSDNSTHRFNTSDLLFKVMSLDYKSHYVNSDTVTYRRQVLIEANGYDESFVRHQDIELNTRILSRYQYEAVKDFLVHVRPYPSDTFPMGIEFLIALKCQFLSRFSDIIMALTPVASETIFQRHVADALKNDKDMPVEEKLSIERTLRHCLRSDDT